ncbi:DUF2961 domain-containing protein [Verrucomicrobia bacterium S94]|nr:DUF2961 domain-containing protein [Verrucomicrobia bacterium S94]
MGKVFCVFSAWITLLGGAWAGIGNYGLAALEHIEELPLIRRGVSAHQVSSFERNGGNADRNSWLYRDDQGDYVIFDEIGAGCIYRIWMTHGGPHPDYKENYASNTWVKIYIDDDVVPRFSCSIADLFSGTVDPFIKPFVGDKKDSSGGLYSYVPIAYATRCRITLDDIPGEEMRQAWSDDTYWMYYNITYHRFSSSDEVVSWTGTEDNESVLAQFNAVGQDPKPTDENIYYAGELTLGADTNCLVADLEGSGVVNSLVFEMPVINKQSWSNLWLSVTWDGQIESSWSVPLGEFFGSGFGQVSVNGLMVGMSNRTCYCYFPMPYWNSATISLENRGSSAVGNVPFRIGVGTNQFSSQLAGYFMAHHAVGSYTNGIITSDFIALNEVGRGHYVGINLASTGGEKSGNNGLAFLEGDERFYIDGCLTPQLHGTGNEDYFNCGWYYNQGSDLLPYHGTPIRSNPFSMSAENNWISAYRIHVGDVIPFNSSIKIGMEHGRVNEVGCRMSSVVYYYKQLGQSSGLSHCGNIDLGNAEDEALSEYQCYGSNEGSVTNTFSFTGDHQDVFLENTGYICTGSTFAVNIPSMNDGLLIRRIFDAGSGRQKARVFVDDAEVGEWYFADAGFSNEVTRWVQGEFYVPFEYTAGKTRSVLHFEADEGMTWNEYAYAVYAINPLVAANDMDADQLPDAWETTYFNNISCAMSDADDDADGMRNMDEFIAGTDPVDRYSYFSMSLNESSLSYNVISGRIYTVFFSTNLAEGATGWSAVRTNSTTTEGMIQENELVDTDQGFFKVRVRLP